MTRYIISPPIDDIWNAASKAREDVERIALQYGYQPFCFHGLNTAHGSPLRMVKLFHTAFANWLHLGGSLPKNSLVLIQYPLYPLKAAPIARFMMRRIQKRKKVRFVAIIHDINTMRNLFGKAAHYSDFHFLKEFDVCICHNDKMKEWLIGQGFDSRRLLILGPFDYLTNSPVKNASFQRGVCLAGNLSPEKCGYLPALCQILTGKVPLHLYGQGIENLSTSSDICYHGSFPPDELPGVLDGSFGLIWDGDSADSCKGEYGEYLRFNAPHKLSLYLASGKPVLIWSQAAMADFVESNNLGIRIDSLYDIPAAIENIDSAAYSVLLQHVSLFSQRLRQGESLRTVLQQAESN